MRTKNGTLTIDTLNPHAWLYHAGENIGLYSRLLQRLAHRILNIVFYDDETKPGNVLRPELARSFVGIYWIIQEFPQCLRSKKCFWIPVLFVKSVDLKTVEGGISAVYVHVFDWFWEAAAQPISTWSTECA